MQTHREVDKNYNSVYKKTMTKNYTFIITGALGWLGKRLIQCLIKQDFQHETLHPLNNADIHIKALIEDHQESKTLESLSPNIKVIK